MNIPVLHGWDLTPSEAIALQKKLARRVNTMSPLGRCKRIAGADVSYNRFSPIFYAAVVVLQTSDWRVIEAQSTVGKSPFPYIPGLLSFREAPILLEVFAKLRQRPNIVMIDGHGLAHPRRFGIACHMGLWLKRPTVGCGKTRLIGEYEPPGANPGDTAPLYDRGEVIGHVLRTKLRTNPLFVSPGHRIDHAGAIRLVLDSCQGYRLPEPIRQAHLHVNELRRSDQGSFDPEPTATVGRAAITSSAARSGSGQTGPVAGRWGWCR
jgi:deoxyribonuclease V